MDKAKTNLGHGQRLDKLWTKFGQTMDKDWTLRPEFVRPTILQECQHLSKVCQKFSNNFVICPNYLNIGQNLDKEMSNLCPIFVQQ